MEPQKLTDRTRRQLFGLASSIHPEANSGQRRDYLRSVAEFINPKGGASVSALSESQARAAVQYLQVKLEAKQAELRRRWQTEVLDKHPDATGFASPAQMKRLANAATDAMRTPEYALGIRRRIRKTGFLSWDFPATDEEIGGLLKAMEGERKHKKTYYYDSTTETGKGPVPRTRHRRKPRSYR